VRLELSRTKVIKDDDTKFDFFSAEFFVLLPVGGDIPCVTTNGISKNNLFR
jgi:hypothetical protein